MRRHRPLAALAAVLLAGCQGHATAAPATRAFTVTGFDRIAVAGPFDVSVHTGPGVSLRATGSPQALDRLVVTVENDMLRIRTNSDMGGNWFGAEMGKVTIAVTVPSLRAATLAGSGNLAIDRAKAERFDANLAGSGDMTIGLLQADSFNASVAGSGNLKAAGKTGAVKASIAGSGDIDASALMAADATVAVVGSGNARLAASHSATVSATGSGDVTVTGTAKCAVTQHGSGSVSCGRG